MVIAFPFPQLLLFFFGQIIDFLTGKTATAIIFARAFRTLNKKQMTRIIPTIGMRVGRFATLVTISNYFS
jgi:hypothetical protein